MIDAPAAASEISVLNVYFLYTSIIIDLSQVLSQQDSATMRISIHNAESRTGT